MKTKGIISLLGLFALFTRVQGQNDSVPNFFEIKARWEEKLSKLSGVENLNGETDDEMEDGELANFNRWVDLWQYRLGPNGEMTTASQVMNQFKNEALVSNTSRNLVSCDPTDDDLIIWSNLGPFNSQGGLGTGGLSNYCGGYLTNTQQQGRIVSISVNPVNPDDIVIGAFNGGIWRTVNAGAPIPSWTNMTDDEGFSLYGANSIVRHPANANIIYASTYGKGGSFGVSVYPYGMGVIMSYDGGTNWQKTSLTYPNFGYWNSQLVKLAIDPNSTVVNTILYTYSNTDVWKWQGDQFANGTWTSIWHDGSWSTGDLWWENLNKEGDMECGPNGDLWFSNYNGLYKIPNGSNTASLLTNYFIPPNYINQPSCGTSAQNLRQDITIEINQQGHIVFHCKFSICSGASATYFYKSTDNGNTWSYVITSARDQFVVNPQNSNMVYAENSNRCMYRYTYNYTTGTESVAPMNNATNHVDVRAIVAFSGNQADGTDNVLYLGTDGGISKTVNGNVWVDITGQGLSLTNYYGVGITETNDKMILAGAQDGSINYYNNGSFFETRPGGDNGDCLINSPGNTIAIQEGANGGQNPGGTHYQGNLIGSSFSTTNTFDIIGGFVNPLCWNPSKSNEFFVGITKCYIGELSNPSLTPIYNQNLHSEKNISCVAASRNNPDIVYYSTGTSGSVDPMDRDGIFKGTRSMSGWNVIDITEITPSASLKTNGVLTSPITDIAVDPNDENRIWVTFGGYQNGQKVFFTSDAGTHWQNLSSNCLPNLPVMAVVFQEMSNDRIYIGTDNGIYYRDSQTDWAYYGKNGPQCIVNDLEINQCAGKLVAATYGRGLWEAPLLKSPEGSTIIGVINWNKPRTIAADLRIVSGSTLNISNTKINIGQGVKIIVEPGALLQLTNDTLTNECGYVWDGIKVWGHSNLIQNSTNQGTLIIDNSIIEHAIDAIEVVRPGDVANTGGIVKAKNSSFLNNKRSVAYYPYETSINQGYFYNCVFKTDANYRHALSLLSHISMERINGLRIWGCTFETNNTWPYDINRVQGISAMDANFTVDAYCPGTSLPCSTPEIRGNFKGLNKAINTSRTTGTYTFSVLESDFQNNVFGIITSAHNNFNIRDCNFRVGKTNAAGAPSTHEGIVIMSGTGFNVDQNSFRPTFASIAPNTIGIRANDTGAEENKIYKNTFIKSSPTDLNVFYGNLANGLNRNTSFPRDGLKYYCNTNLNNKKNGYDIAVTDQGISYSQGTLSYPAKNSFSWGTQLTGAPSFSDFNNGAFTGTIAYYYNLVGQEEPKNIFSVSKFLTSNTSNSCPNLYNSGNGDPVDPIPAYAQAGDQYEEVKQTLGEDLDSLNNLMDGGNEPALLEKIHNVKADTKNELLQQLIKIAPFISIEIMEALFTKIDNPLTNDEFKEIALANPDVFVNNTLNEDCIVSGIFKEEEISYLLEQVTDRTILENEINDLHSAMFTICNKAISIIVDNPEVFSSKEIITWLGNKNSLNSDMELVDLFINQLNFSEARMLLYNLDEKYKLLYDEKVELDYFIQVKEVQIALKRENLAINELGPDLIAILEPIAMNSKGLGGDQARSMLNQNGYKYFVPPVFPASNKVKEPEAEVLPNTQTTLKSGVTAVNLLTAAPNPATSELHFSYKLQSNIPCFIFLRDHIGNVVVKLEVKDNFGTISWNCEDLSTGVYFYSLETEEQMLIKPKNVLIIR